LDISIRQHIEETIGAFHDVDDGSEPRKKLLVFR
jgi:hypothetical protein